MYRGNPQKKISYVPRENPRWTGGSDRWTAIKRGLTVYGKKSLSQESKKISASEPEYMAFLQLEIGRGQNITGHLANQTTRKLCLHTRSFKQRENNLVHK